MRFIPLRRWLTVPRPTGWHLFAGLLLLALASEYWDKDPLALGGGLLVPWPRFVLAMAALPLIVPATEWRWSRLRCWPKTVRPLLFFWICAGLSAVGLIVAPGRSDAFQFVKTYVHLTMYVVFVGAVVRWTSRERFWMLVRGYYAVGVAAGILSVLQFVHGGLGLFGFLAPLTFQSAEYAVGEGLTTGFRAASFFGEPSWAARYYVHFIAVALAFWWSSHRRRHLAAVVLFLAAFYLANSLLGYVILCTFGIAVLIAQMWRRNMFSMSQPQRLLLAGGAYGVLLLWLLDLLPRLPDLLDRSIARIGLVVQGGGGAGNRIDSVFAGLEVWKLAPVFGVGLGNIDTYIVQFYQDPAWVLRSRFASDSLYVQLVAELGIAGLAAFLWLWARLLWFGAPRGFSSRSSPEAARTYTLMRFLQLDLFAQAVGMINSSDYLNPHLWTVVSMVLICKQLLAHGPERSMRETAPATPPAAVLAPA